jgi:hypothetical protein
MKLQNRAFCFGLMLFIMLASGCIHESRAGSALTPETSSQVVSSPTAVPQFIPVPLDTLTPVSSPTTVPTLAAEKARTKLLDLLAMNGGCRLPCFWGITPGKSSYQDVQAILVALSSLSHSLHLNPSGASDITPRLTEGDLEIYNRAAFLTSEKDVVYRIAFNAEAHRPLPEGGYIDVFNSKFFGEKTSAYSLSHVLAEQGVPASVMIQTAGGPLTRGGTGGFDILLLYPDQGILVNYTTQMQMDGTYVRGCPSNAHVEMELYPPGNSDSFFEHLKQTDWAVRFSGYQALEEVTSMSPKEFYEIFRQPSDRCIETAAKLWPTQEP